MSKTSDAVVIGGGVIGLATAAELLRRGMSVTSVYPRAGDRESASRAAGAMLGAFGEVTADDEGPEIEELEFRLAAQRRYPDWLGDLCERTGRTVHQAKGTVIAANNDGGRDRASIKRMKAEADRLHEPARWVDPEDVPGLCPGPGHVPGLCLHLENEHSVDSGQLLDAMVAALAGQAGAAHLDDQVLTVRPAGQGWVVKTKGGAQLNTPHVVLCGGSRSFEVLDDELRRALALPELFFGKGVSCIVKGAPPIPQTIRTPNRAFACGIHVVPRAGADLLYLGATNCMGTDHEKERGFQPGELHSLFDEIIHQINTGIRTSHIELIRYGYRPIPALRRPLIGKTSRPGLSVATGTYRNGILMSPLVAEVVADEMGLPSHGSPRMNPFPAIQKQAVVAADLARLADVGIRDIIAFLHEPRGSLPYNRAAELECYVRALFEMAVADDGRLSDLRRDIRLQLETAPFNETMHRLFYEVVGRVGANGLPELRAKA